MSAAQDPHGDRPRPVIEEGTKAWRRRRAHEIRAELDGHIERRTEALIAAGYSPDAARAEARRRLGDLQRIEGDCMRIAERHRARMRAAGWVEDAVQDVKVALRTFRRRPVLAGAVVLTMGIAIAAATSVYSMVRGVLLEPLAFPQSERLYSVYTRYLPETGYDFEYFPLSGPELLDYRETTRAMSGVAAWFAGSMNLRPPGGEPERLRVVQASADLFDVLGVGAALGRTFVAADGDPSAACVAILSDGLWRDRFGSDRGVLGRDVSLNGTPCTIGGVMPPDFAFPDDRTRLYTVLKLDPANPSWHRQSHPYAAVARLGAGASRMAADAELDALHGRWSAEFPDHYARGHFIVLQPFAEDLVGDARTPLLVLLGAVGIVLLVVIVNVAGLVLAGAETRRREFAVRAGLGVGRARLVRQLLTENMVLALIGGALGILASGWVLRGLVALYPGRLPRANDVTIDGPVLLFSVAIAVVSGLFFGALPALRLSAVQLAEVLRTAGRGLTAHGGGVRARRLFVVAQTALALVLALGATVLARSHAHVRAVELGFDPERVLTFAVAVPPGSYPEDARARDYFLRLEDRLSRLPGIEAAGTISDLPLRSGGGADDFIIDGKPLPAPGEPAWNARYLMATPSTLDALGLDLIDGRWLSETDLPGGPPVAVINEAAARYWDDGNPIGRRLRYFGADSAWIAIVGMVRDVRQLGVTTDPPPAIYVSLAQAPRRPYAGRFNTLVVRYRGDAARVVPSVRAAAAQIDPTLPLSEITTLATVVDEAVGDSRFTTTLMMAFAGIALILGALGVYGVLAHTVNMRKHEIGIRLALGADPGSVLGMVVRQGLVLVAAGAILGLVATLALRGAIVGILYGVQPLDLPSIGFALGTLLLTSVAACCIPAWRAAALDPLDSLRQE